jgi:hypothetical protein
VRAPHPLYANAAAQVHGSERPAVFGAAEQESTLVMEHALADAERGERVWTKRATLVYRDASQFVSYQSGQVASVQLGPAALEGAEAEAFKQLIEQGGAYSIRIPSVLTDPASPPVVASVPACALLRSGFKETLALQIDVAGHVVSLGYTVKDGVAECAPGTWQVTAAAPTPSSPGARA